MKKLIALLTALVMLFAAGFGALADATFDEQFRCGALTLEPAPMPAWTEGVLWLSISPSGRYMLGLTDVSLILYNVGDQTFAPLAIDLRTDGNGKLAKLLRQPQSLTKFTFAWSPDERYFTGWSYDLTMLQMSLCMDLLLGDTRQKTVAVMESWKNRMMAENGGGVYAACFSPDGGTLYYAAAGRAFSSHGSNYVTMAYDIATDTSTLVALNEWQQDDATYYAYWADMYCLADGSIVQAASPRSSDAIIMRRLIPSDGGWLARNMAVSGIQNPVAPRIKGANGTRSLMLLIPATTVSTATPYASMAMHIKAPNNAPMASGMLFNAGNVCLSPDGRYVLSLSGNTKSFSLLMTDLASGEAHPVMLAAGAENYDYPLLHGGNPLAQRFSEGILWGGDYLLLGGENSAVLHRFRGVAPAGGLEQ